MERTDPMFSLALQADDWAIYQFASDALAFFRKRNGAWEELCFPYRNRPATRFVLFLKQTNPKIRELRVCMTVEIIAATHNLRAIASENPTEGQYSWQFVHNR